MQSVPGIAQPKVAMRIGQEATCIAQRRYRVAVVEDQRYAKRLAAIGRALVVQGELRRVVGQQQQQRVRHQDDALVLARNGGRHVKDLRGDVSLWRVIVAGDLHGRICLTMLPLASSLARTKNILLNPGVLCMP